MADEDALTVPQEWLPLIHPRRGGLPGPAVELEDRDVALRLLDGAAGRVRDLRDGTAGPGLAEAARRHLDGAPDPAGAAAVAAAVAGPVPRNTRSDVLAPTYRSFVDLWIADHGIVFAARALLELCRTTYDDTPGAGVRHPAVHMFTSNLTQSVRPNLGNLLRVRTLLAASADDVYAEADRLLPAVRWHPVQQRTADWLVVYLLPTRQDDADRLLASARWPGFDPLVHCSLGRPGQATAVPTPDSLSAGEVATLLEGVGTDALRLLVRNLNGLPHAETRDRLLAAIAVIPTDDALRVLLERRARPEARGPLKAAMARFPVRAARLLAGPYADAAAMLLRGHVRSHRDVLAAALPGLPDAARTALAPLVDPPPPLPEVPAGEVPGFLADAPPKRRPRPAEWPDASTLPQVRLRGDARALPLDSVRRLLEVLAQRVPHRVAEMREACDPDSLARFGRAVFELWRDAGEPKKDDWALLQLGRTGDDATVRVLAPLLRTWPSQGGRGKAAKALGVLTALGTDPALMHLTGIAEKGRQATLRKAARLEIDELARRRGLTADELADRLVPRFGLAADGSMTLDYGPRRFVVGFDEELKPYILDEKGRRRASLPKPGAKDDPELAAAARATFAALRKDVRAVASTQLHRYEAAMLTGRRWTARDFRDHVAGHPFVRHLARRLLWVAEPAPGNGGSGGGPATPFRIAEDRTFADIDDEEFELPESSRVGVVHPLHLDGPLPAWSRVFADYEIVQPFAQLGRPVLAFTGAERDGAELRRFAGLTVPVQAVMRLEPRGWVRGEAGDGANQTSISKRVGADRYAVMGLSPGILVGDVYRHSGDQELSGVRLTGDGLRFGDLDPLAASELLGDLTALAAEAVPGP